MNLTTKRLARGTYVNGGRIVRAIADLVVPSAGYDDRLEEHQAVDMNAGPGSPKSSLRSPAASAKWVNARAGDIAIEVVAPRAGGKVLGYMFISGQAVNVLHYRGKPEEFEVAVGWRIDPSITAGEKACSGGPVTPGDIIHSMMHVKYGAAALAHFEINALHLDDLNAACQMMSYAFALEPFDKDSNKPVYEGEPRTHVIGSITCKKPTKHHAILHLQPPCDKSDYAVQPFVHELLRTSKALVETPFWRMVEGSKMDRVKARMLAECDSTAEAHPDAPPPQRFRDAISALPDRALIGQLPTEERKVLERSLKDFGL